MKEFYKCPLTGDPHRRNPKYKTPNAPKEKEPTVFRNPDYEDDDNTGHWGPSPRSKRILH